MTKILRFRVLALLLFMCAFGAPKSYADHISSADMYVDYIGSGPNDLRYRVTAVFYRICIGDNLALDTIAYGFQVRSLNAGLALGSNQPWTRNLTLRNPNIEDTLDFLCPQFSAINSCRVPANTSYSGYTRRIYTDTVTLPSRQTDYYFSWSSCCRLQSYANIAQSGPSFYLETKMNTLARYDNSTPRYNSLPFVFCCVNQPSSLSNLPSDPDGDSISTMSVVPMQTNAPTYINYNPGYNAAIPTGITGYYNVAATTGRANFLPTATGKMALGYRTYDFDPVTKDTLSWVSRDLTITVLPCTNLPPYIDSIPQSLTGVRKIDTTGGEVVLTVCSQAELDFDINARSNNANGMIYMYPASRLPSGMSMTPTVSGGTGIAKLKWRPTAAQVGRYTISILAVDSTCTLGQEITLRNEFTFTVIVRAALDAGPDVLICPLGDRAVQLGTNAPATNNFTWTNDAGGPAQFLDCTDCPDPKARPDRDYYYVVTIDNPEYDCKLSDTVGVLIDNSVRITAPQDSLLVCRPSMVQLQSTVDGPAPQQNLQCGVNNPVACNPGDEETATAGVGFFGPLAESNTPFFSRQQYMKYQYIIPKRQLLDAGLYGGTINTISFQTIEAAILAANPLTNFTVSLACVDEDRYSTTPSNASFLGATPVATINSLTLTPNSWNDIAFTTPYSWDTSKNLLVDICVGPMTVNNQNGIDPVAMVPGHAIQKFSNTLNVCAANAPSVQYFPQRPVTRFKFCPSPALPFQFSWQPGDLLEDSTVQNPFAYIERSRQLVVYTVGRNSCLIRDTLNVILPEHRLENGPQDTFICRNQPAYLRASGGDAYNWFEFNNGVFSDASGSLNCTDCATPVATPQQTTEYAVVFTNDVNRGNPDNPNAAAGCPDTMYLKVNVWPLPTVYSPNSDTMIKFGERVQLFARGASRYLWTPVTGVTDPNSPAPFVAPQTTTNYIVTGMDSNGCAARDTVTVSIDYQVNQLVPTGFTPNNDGLNDVFKIVNPSFYRLMEFRVFNRWGQEIFSTTDINHGWDGTWKGVAQQMGSYNYLIRVGSPDGNIMSYKGDVTLIR